MFDKIIKEVEVDDEEEQQIIAETRHNEIRNLFSKLITAVQEKPNDTLSEEIKTQTLALNKIVGEIKDISVNVELNPQEFVSSINKICEDIIASNDKVIETLNTRLLPDTFVLVKGYGNITESVNVLYKPANQILNKK